MNSRALLFVISLLAVLTCGTKRYSVISYGPATREWADKCIRMTTFRSSCGRRTTDECLSQPIVSLAKNWSKELIYNLPVYTSQNGCMIALEMALNYSKSDLTFLTEIAIDDFVGQFPHCCLNFANCTDIVRATIQAIKRGNKTFGVTIYDYQLWHPERWTNWSHFKPFLPEIDVVHLYLTCRDRWSMFPSYLATIQKYFSGKVKVVAALWAVDSVDFRNLGFSCNSTIWPRSQEVGLFKDTLNMMYREVQNNPMVIGLEFWPGYWGIVDQMSEIYTNSNYCKNVSACIENTKEMQDFASEILGSIHCINPR